MPESATLKTSNSPQVIIERLARKQISDEEAEKTLQEHWRTAYDTPNLVKFVRGLFRRVSK